MWNNDNQTAIMYAATKGHIDIVKALIDRGVDINVKDKDNDTALIIAKKNGYNDIVQFLIESGAKE